MRSKRERVCVKGKKKGSKTVSLVMFFFTTFVFIPFQIQIKSKTVQRIFRS